MEKIERIKTWKRIYDYYDDIWDELMQYETDFWRKANDLRIPATDKYEREHINSLLKLTKDIRYNFDDLDLKSLLCIKKELFRNNMPVYFGRGLGLVHMEIRDAGIRGIFSNLEKYAKKLLLFKCPQRPGLTDDYLNGKINLDKEE